MAQPADRLEQEAVFTLTVKRLYVRTDDFRLAHRLLSELQGRNLPAKQVSPSQPIEADAYWFGTPEEVESIGVVPFNIDEELANSCAVS